MAKTILDKETNKTIFFSDEFEKELLNKKERNLHSEIRYQLAKMFNLNNLAKDFSKYINLPYLTVEQVTERYEQTKLFVNIIEVIYGHKAANYISQFL